MAKEITRGSIQRKEYDYKLDTVTLNFVLRSDNPSELRPFLKLLEVAIEEVKADLIKMKTK